MTRGYGEPLQMTFHGPDGKPVASCGDPPGRKTMFPGGCSIPSCKVYSRPADRAYCRAILRLSRGHYHRLKEIPRGGPCNPWR